jgi:hypothetical protein
MVSKRFGFPLLSKRLRTRPIWTELLQHLPIALRSTLFKNPEASSLGIDVRFSERDLATGVVSTVLLAREDMKDLTIHQVEALVKFRQTGKMKPAQDADASNLLDNFATFFEELKLKKVAEGDATWLHATVPPQGSAPNEEVFSTPEEEFEATMRSMGMF